MAKRTVVPGEFKHGRCYKQSTASIGCLTRATSSGTDNVFATSVQALALTG